jgi:hypothetical protein
MEDSKNTAPMHGVVAFNAMRAVVGCSCTTLNCSSLCEIMPPASKWE